MNRIVLLLLVLPLFTHGQEVTLAPANVAPIYEGYKNPLRLSVAQGHISKATLTTDNGTITEENGIYYLKPVKEGLAVVDIYAITNKGKFTRKDTFRVLPLPLPIAMVAGKAGGTLPAVDMRAQVSVAAKSLLLLPKVCLVQQFTFTLIRDGRLIGRETVRSSAGVRFSGNNHIAQMFATLRSGDIVMFTGIKGWWQDKERDLNSIEFILNDDGGDREIIVEDPVTGNKTVQQIRVRKPGEKY